MLVAFFLNIKTLLSYLLHKEYLLENTGNYRYVKKRRRRNIIRNATTWRYAVDFLVGILSVSLGPPTHILSWL